MALSVLSHGGKVALGYDSSTNERGFLVKMLNRTGGVSVKGTLLAPSTTAGAPSALTAANAELQRTLQEANQLKGLFDAESLGDQLARAEEGTAGLMAQSSPAATGTFSAAAAMAMFGAGRDDAAKETAENTRAMRRRMDQAARQGNVYPVFVG